MTVDLSVDDVRTAIAEYVERQLDNGLKIDANDIRLTVGTVYADHPMDRGTTECTGAKVSITPKRIPKGQDYA